MSEREKSPGLARGPVLVGVALAVVAAGLLLPRMGWANGGTLRLANVVMGDYRVSVFTDPTPVRPDSLDVSLLILQEGTLGVPEDLEVTVSSRALDGQAPGETLSATRGQADDPRYYATKFALGAEGRWEIGIRVSGPAGEGEASFEVTARERGILGHPLVLSLLALLPLVLVGIWILRQDEDESPHDASSTDAALQEDPHGGASKGGASHDGPGHDASPNDEGEPTGPAAG